MKFRPLQFMAGLFRSGPKVPQLSEGERLAIFAERMDRFWIMIAERRRQAGHIVYAEGVSVHPSAWPACPPNCEHVLVESGSQEVKK